MLEIGNSSMTAPISQFPVGTYKKAHRHGPGAHVVILDGIGYSLMWPEGAPIQRFDWKPGSVVVPPDQWFHQHFNVGPAPARYLALRWGSRKYRVFKSYGIEESIKQGGDQIEYADEAPEIRQLFLEECRKHGVTPRMDEHWSNAYKVEGCLLPRMRPLTLCPTAVLRVQRRGGTRLGERPLTCLEAGSGLAAGYDA